MAAIAEIRLGEINAKEDLSLRLGDALDVKASIGLAVILFLATQSAYLLDKGLPRFGMAMQIVAIACVVLAAVFALMELWPQVYVLPEPESPEISQRIKELTVHYGNYPDVEMHAAKAFMDDQIYWATKRIAGNQKKNRWKSTLLALSFLFTGGAVAINLLTVLLSLRTIF
jgi:hypothetical protein